MCEAQNFFPRCVHVSLQVFLYIYIRPQKQGWPMDNHSNYFIDISQLFVGYALFVICP